MGLAVYTYSPKEINLFIAGHKVQGWNSISISPSAPTFKVIKGIRGKNTRVRNKDSSCTIRISVDQTSFTNSVLDQIIYLDKTYGTGRLTVSLTNPLGHEVFFTDTAFIEGKANLDFSDVAGDREWTIHCLNSDYSSGSDGVSGMLGSILGGLF